MRWRRTRRGSETGTYEFRIEARHEGHPPVRISVTYTITPGVDDTWDEPGYANYAEIDPLPVGLVLTPAEHTMLQDEIVEAHEWDDGCDE